jgi:cytochrome c556
MMPARIVAFTGILALASAAAHSQSSEAERAGIVTARQMLMGDLLSAYWPVNDIQRGKSTDYAAAEAAARSVPGLVEAFLPLMVAGTAKGEAPGSRATPEVWSESGAFLEAAADLQAKALALADAAQAGDAGTYAPAFEAFAESCVGCHDFRPSSGGRFRFAE